MESGRWAPGLRADTIGVFYALDADLKSLRGDSAPTSYSAGGTHWQSFVLANHRILAAKMRVGSTETAVTVASVLAKNVCDVVVSIGPAGCLDATMSVGEKFKVCEVVGFQRGSWSGAVWGLASEAVGECGNLPVPLSDMWASGVRMASGEAFVAGDAARDRIHNETGTSAIDMNSFGLLQACKRAGVKPVILRAVSDHAGDAASEEFREFARSYSGEMGTILRGAILQLAPSKENPQAHENLRDLLGE
ncbi:MAG: hypothetical protein WCG66_08155 [bacterium]